ncbi:MAG TPA: hypothetical protein PK205_16455 [Promineifilum sp.]|nr:hypothetical protein [Promineifilum sp.]
MNDFENENMYELSDSEGKRNTRGIVTMLLYLVLAAVVIITGAHAVMLVLSQTSGFATGGGMIDAILTGIRVAFPLLVELAAVVAGIGFIQARWRGAQKTVGLGIELVWLIFAALNMITFFAVERGQALQTWQVNWIQYGLPLSALIAGSLTYVLMRVDPSHKRDQERAATAERVDAMKFKFRQRALLSPALLNIEKQRAFMQVIDELRRDGYSENQIRFMIQHTPELLSDGDENGVPDAMQIGPSPAPQPARPPSWIDDLRGRLAGSIPTSESVGNSTHDAPRQAAPTAPPLAHPTGQGNGPAAKPYGGAPDFTERP